MDYEEYLYMDVVIREHHGRCRSGFVSGTFMQLAMDGSRGVFVHGCSYPRTPWTVSETKYLASSVEMSKSRIASTLKQLLTVA